MIGKAFTTFMLTQEHNFWYSIVESHSHMLPVAYMIAKSKGENTVSKIVAVKEEPEGIDNAFVFFDDDQDCRSRTSAPGTRGLDGFGGSALVPGWR
jgi:hypothetical protein